MKMVKKIWDEFVYGGHFLALGDAVTLYVFGVILNIPVTWDFLAIIYLCVFSANLYNRGKESETDALTNPERVKVMKKYTDNSRAVVSVSMFTVVMLLLYFANIAVLLFAGVIFLISILYSVFLKGMTNKIVGFKSFVAALFYALMVFLLVFYYFAPVTLAVFLIFIFYYIRIFISNAYCDFKDIKGDKKRGLKTVAVSLGEKNAIRFLNTLNILSAIPILAGIYLGVLPLFSVMLLLTIAYAFYYFSLNEKADKEVLSNAIIDGEFILWLPYILIGEYLL